LLAENGFDVCTGGFAGIMEAVSKGAAEKGRDVIGVTVNLWNSTPNQYITNEVKCSSIFERLDKLIEIGDAYIILQGGTGTLLELAAVWELSNKGLMDHKPIACHSSMWQGVTSIINIQMKKEGRNIGLVKAFENIRDMVENVINDLKN
jgi:uncharacterized protein (TIGR00725 family)